MFEDESPLDRALLFVVAFALVGFGASVLVMAYLKNNYYADDIELCRFLPDTTGRCANGAPPSIVDHLFLSSLLIGLLAGILGWFVGVTVPKQPVESPVSVRARCTQCGNPRQPGDQYCGKCGALLD